MTYAIWGMATMAGTYKFTAPYVPPEDDNTNWSVFLSLEASSTSEESAASEVASILQRMDIRWLRPLAKPQGLWKLNRAHFAKYFSMTDRTWLVGDQILRPIFDRVEVSGRMVSVIRFIVAPEGPLAWGHGSQSVVNSWSDVERLRGKLQSALETGLTSDDFQHVGLLARDLTIVLAQAVYDPIKHLPTDGAPGSADAKRMLSDYLSAKLKESRKEYIAIVKAVYDFAVNLQHKRTTTYIEAAICATAVLALVETIHLLESDSSE